MSSTFILKDSFEQELHLLSRVEYLPTFIGVKLLQEVQTKLVFPSLEFILKITSPHFLQVKLQDLVVFLLFSHFELSILE